MQDNCNTECKLESRNDNDNETAWISKAVILGQSRFGFPFPLYSTLSLPREREYTSVSVSVPPMKCAT